MSDETRQREQTDMEPAAVPVTAGADGAVVRLTFWQTVLSVVGVLIAIIALYAALSESRAVRQQTAAAVWPFVQLSIQDYDGEHGARFGLSFTNAGVGPAKMRALRIHIGGLPVTDWREAVLRVGGDPAAPVARNFIRGRVLRPDETVTVISTMDAPLARRFQAAMADGESAIVYCYCSIFDDCWLADSRADLQAPEPVAACPDFGDSGFSG